MGFDASEHVGSMGPPMNLGPVINTVGLERRPALSFDGRSLYFFSNGHGGSGLTDLFVSTRTRRDGFDDVTTMTDLLRRRDETRSSQGEHRRMSAKKRRSIARAE